MQESGELQNISPLEEDVSVPDVCNSYPSFADCRAVRWMAGTWIVCDLDTCQPSVLDDCSWCIKVAMTNTSRASRAHAEFWAGVVLHIDVATMNVLSIGGAGCIVALIDEASGTLTAFHMKLKSGAFVALNPQGSWVEEQYSGMVKTIVMYGWTVSVKGWENLEVRSIEAYPTALYMPQENERDELKNYTIKNGIPRCSFKLEQEKISGRESLQHLGYRQLSGSSTVFKDVWRAVISWEAK